MKRVLPTILLLLVSLPTLAQAQPKRRVLDKKFWLALGSAVGLMVADVELSQRCIRAGTCREANPLLGQSRGRAYAVNTAILVPVTIWSYHVKKGQDRTGRQKGDIPWWFPSAINASSHVVGMSIGVYASTIERQPRTSSTLASMRPNFGLGVLAKPTIPPESWRVGFEAMDFPRHVQVLLSTTHRQAIK